ncbi:Uncharacterised protein [Clostridium sporogenes]|nr:Uncharacterised protein [Clostridium sporogenes]
MHDTVQKYSRYIFNTIFCIKFIQGIYKGKKLYFLFKHKKYTYIILYSENNLIYSNFIYEGEKEDHKIERVLKKADELNINLNTIYGINIEESFIKDKLKEYNFVSLQKFREKDYKRII